jgi:hypothetical protein
MGLIGPEVQDGALIRSSDKGKVMAALCFITLENGTNLRHLDPGTAKS